MPYEAALTAHYQALSNPEDTLARNIETVISSYNSPWDILTELLQNSVDAIFERKRREPTFNAGSIRIEVDAPAGTLTIEDNGTGIPAGKYIEMVLPGGSLKQAGTSYGHKGLGFTYCAHVSDAVEVETVCDDGSAEHWKFENGFNWINDRTAQSTTVTTGLTGALREFTGTGTAVRLTLAVGRYEVSRANTSVLDKFFDWANDERLLSFVLRTRTAIGQTFNLFGKAPPVDIEIFVTLKDQGSKFPVHYSFFDFYNYAPLSSSPYQKATEYANHIYHVPTHLNKTHFGIYHVFDTDPTSVPPVLKAGVHKGGVQFSAYVFASGKDNLAAALGQYDPRLGSSHRYLAFTTDVHMSIDGMPSGVPIDNWTNFGGFEQRYFCIIDAQKTFGSVLDAGRKTVTRHYVDLFVEKVVELTKNGTFFNSVTFQQLAQQLNNRTGASHPTPVADIVARWAAKPQLASKSLLLSVLPDDELAVYLLFGELVGRGFLPGWKSLYVSGTAVYDTAMEFRYDFANLAFGNATAGGSCLFGPGAGVKTRYPSSGMLWADSSGARKFLVVECKVEAQELLREVQKARSSKNFSEVDVLICMTLDPAAIKTLLGSVHKEPPAARQLSGVTHILQWGNHSIHVICLETVIADLVGAGQLK